MEIAPPHPQQDELIKLYRLFVHDFPDITVIEAYRLGLIDDDMASILITGKTLKDEIERGDRVRIEEP